MRKTGFSLVELLAVIAVIVVLAAIGVPAAKQILNSFESSAHVKHFISAALASARAIAVREQAYAGVRFQQDLAGNQYMIFIVNDPDSAPDGTGLANGFCPVGGYKAMKLSENVGLMDLRIRMNYEDASDPLDESIRVVGNDVESNLNIDDPCELTDTTTFSIVFSPAGKLVIHEVRTRNRHGYRETSDSTSDDQVFNKMVRVDSGLAMFYQDDYANLGLGQEPSRNHFVVYDKNEFGSVRTDSRWTDYLQYLEVVYVSPYTGQIINK